MRPVSLTGIKPTGSPHLGNYLGMIHPVLELAAAYDARYFIADYHALTTVRDREAMANQVYDVAATWLALGLDPEQVIFYRQSDVPEVFKFTWILDCFTAKGLLNRAHAYKAAVDENARIGHNEDDGINAGLYNYPVLVATDILLFNADVVPVGLDQKQHIEIARDIASVFNHTYGNLLKLPDALIRSDVAVVPALDGRKMSKSYNNTIQVFAPRKQLRKQVMRIVTDSKRPEDPKNPDECNLFAIYKHFAPPDSVTTTRRKYLMGGLAYGDLKQELFELLDARFDKSRERYTGFLQDRVYLDRVLQVGADKARQIALPLLYEVRDAIGMRRLA